MEVAMCVYRNTTKASHCYFANAKVREIEDCDSAQNASRDKVIKTLIEDEGQEGEEHKVEEDNEHGNKETCC